MSKKEEENKEESKQATIDDKDKNKEKSDKEKEKDKKKKEEDDLDNQKALNEEEIRLMKAYSFGPYDDDIKLLEKGTKKRIQDIENAMGIKESDRGLAPPSQWDLNSDKVALQQDQPLLVARCTKIIEKGANEDERQYMIVIRQIAKYVVDLGENVAPTDIEEAMRVGVDRSKYRIQIPLPPKIDASVTMMTVEEKPDVTYDDVGGCKEQIEKLREVVELPLLQPGKFVALGIDPPKGVLLYGPPGTGKTLLARAMANEMDCNFMKIVSSSIVDKYIGESARLIREMFAYGKSHSPCIIFFDEIDAIGGRRLSAGTSADREIQRTLMELMSQIDGFDDLGQVKVMMATNRPDILDPALLRPGRLDRKIKIPLPNEEARLQIIQIHAKKLTKEENINYKSIVSLSEGFNGADLRNVCTEAGMFAIREYRKFVIQEDFMKAVRKVKEGKKLEAICGEFEYTKRY